MANMLPPPPPPPPPGGLAGGGEGGLARGHRAGLFAVGGVIGLSPLYNLTLCGSQRGLVVSTEPLSLSAHFDWGSHTAREVAPCPPLWGARSWEPSPLHPVSQPGLLAMGAGHGASSL